MNLTGDVSWQHGFTMNIVSSMTFNEKFRFSVVSLDGPAHKTNPFWGQKIPWVNPGFEEFKI